MSERAPGYADLDILLEAIAHDVRCSTSCRVAIEQNDYPAKPHHEQPALLARHSRTHERYDVREAGKVHAQGSEETFDEHDVAAGGSAVKVVQDERLPEAARELVL